MAPLVSESTALSGWQRQGRFASLLETVSGGHLT